MTAPSSAAIESRASSALVAVRMVLVGAMPTLVVCLANSQLPVRHEGLANPHLWSYRLIFLWMLFTANLHWAVGFVLTTRYADSRFRASFGFLGVCVGLVVYGLTLSATDATLLGNGLGLSSAADHASDVAAGFIPAYLLSQTPMPAHPAFRMSRVALTYAAYSMLSVELGAFDGYGWALSQAIMISLVWTVGFLTKRVPFNLLVAFGISAAQIVIEPNPAIAAGLVVLVALARSGWTRVVSALRWLGNFRLLVRSTRGVARHRPIGIIEDAAVGLASLIAVGVRPVARAEWTAERVAGPADGTTQAQHLRLVLGLVSAAAKIRAALLVAPFLRFVDWIAVSESRTRRAATVVVSSAATYLFRSYGFGELLRTCESLAVLGGGVQALAHFRRKVIKERERIAGIDVPAERDQDEEQDQL